MSERIGRPSPATVIASVALFVALSGSSYAAIKANSIGAKQIKPNAVASSELKNGAVGSSEVGDGAITGADIADESVGSQDVAGLGSADVAGLSGDDVTDESLGAADVGGLGSDDVTDGSLAAGDVATGTFLGSNVTAQTEIHPSDLAGGDSATLTVFCPAGQIATGGGIRGDDQDSEVTTVTGTRPAKAPGDTQPPADGEAFRGWRGTVLHNTGDATAGIRPEIWVSCAPQP